MGGVAIWSALIGGWRGGGLSGLGRTTWTSGTGRKLVGAASPGMLPGHWESQRRLAAAAAAAAAVHPLSTARTGPLGVTSSPSHRGQRWEGRD